MLTPIPFAPGVVRDDTAYAAKGRWYDADKTRFVVAGGVAWPETIQGWDFVTIDQYSGVCRGLHSYLDNSSQPHISVGTNLQLYDAFAGTLYEVTPTKLGASGTLSGPFSTISGERAVLVVHSNHHFIPNDIVVYTSGIALGGIFISGAYAVTAVVNSSQYTILNPTSATATVNTSGGQVNWRGPRGTLSGPFNTVRGSTLIVVNHSGHQQSTGDVVVYETEVSLGGALIIGAYQVTRSGADQYTINVTAAATTTASGGGTVVYRYPRFSLSGPFETTTGSTTVTVTQVGHLLNPGDYRIFQSASAVGGVTVSGEYQVSSVPTSDTFTITVASAATSAASGGGNPTYYDLIPVGLQDGLGGYGYGIGAYGIGAYGLGQTLLAFVPRTWSFATWDSNQVLGCPWGQGIFLFSNVETARAANLPNSPRNVNAMFVTPEAFVAALGCTNTQGVYDPMLIRIADQATLDVWTPSALNQARVFRPTVGSILMAGLPGSRENVIFADTAMYSFQYIGDQDPDLVYALNFVAGVGLIGPKAACQNTREGAVWFLGNDRQFYIYRGGAPQAIPCPNRDWFFEDFASAQEYKVHLAYIGARNEVWVFGPTTGTNNEIGKYMILNVITGIWSIGYWDRTSWIDRDATPFPVAAGFDSKQIFYQEYGQTSGGQAFVGRVRSAAFDFG
ncbi:MAG: hypothetical protein FJW37_07900, partial [Acidobacteria bacterium]|nr:hypothetical protein [Acidobacteriota bacterium]